MAIEVWSELSRGLSEMVRNVDAAVVRVGVGRRAAASGTVWSTDGVVVTALHGLDADGDVEVTLASGERLEAEVVGRDPATDLAVVRAKAAGLAAAPWAPAAAVEVGALVLVVTRPGRGPRATLGMVARVGDAWRTPPGGRIDSWIELEVALHAGFSGGVIVDPIGRAVGLATAGLVRGTPLAIPVATLTRVVSSLLEHGSVRRGYLGVASLPVRLPRALGERSHQAGGLLVTAVEEDSPAAKGGVMVGDVLLSMAGAPLADLGDLLPLLEEERIGQLAETRISRGGVVQTLAITLGARGRGGEGGGRP